MFIKYNRPNAHMIPGMNGTKIYRLMPGWNEFPSKVFKAYEKHPEIARFIEEGVIEVMDEKKVEKKGKRTVTKRIGQDDKPLNLKDLTEAKAIAVVKETHNRDLLERWLDAETRTKVKRALEKQIKPLQNAKSENNQQ